MVTRKTVYTESSQRFPWRSSIQLLALELLLWSPLHVASPSVEPERPLSVQCAQGPELQRHGVRTGAGGVLVLQSVVVVVFDWFAPRVVREWPEAVKMDLFAEASGHRVHEEAGGRALDVDIVG